MRIKFFFQIEGVMTIFPLAFSLKITFSFKITLRLVICVDRVLSWKEKASSYVQGAN